jgi:hypothetical protein
VSAGEFTLGVVGVFYAFLLADEWHQRRKRKGGRRE